MSVLPRRSDGASSGGPLGPKARRRESCGCSCDPSNFQDSGCCMLPKLLQIGGRAVSMRDYGWAPGRPQHPSADHRRSHGSSNPPKSFDFHEHFRRASRADHPQTTDLVTDRPSAEAQTTDLVTHGRSPTPYLNQLCLSILVLSEHGVSSSTSFRPN